MHLLKTITSTCFKAIPYFIVILLLSVAWIGSLCRSPFLIEDKNFESLEWKESVRPADHGRKSDIEEGVQPTVSIGLGSTTDKAGSCGIEKKNHDLYKGQKKESTERTAIEWQECASCAIYNVGC